MNVTEKCHRERQTGGNRKNRDALRQHSGRIEASFASKLVATLKPTTPVIDKFVLKNFGLRLPYTYAPGRERKTVAIYDKLCSRYEALLHSPTGRLICARFSERFPQSDIEDLKKIDLVLWQHRG